MLLVVSLASLTGLAPFYRPTEWIMIGGFFVIAGSIGMLIELRRKRRFGWRKRKGFTLIELLIAIGILGVLLSIVIVALNPKKQLKAARCAQEAQSINQLQKASVQYLVSAWKLPGDKTLPSSAASALPVCKQGVTDATCVSMDVLVPDVITAIPVNPFENTDILSGYQVYQHTGRPFILASSTVSGPTDYTAYWKLDDGAGSIATDASGAHNGTLTNMNTVTSWDTGVPPGITPNPYALRFDGSNDYVDGTALNISGNEISFGGWVKFSSFTTSGVGSCIICHQAYQLETYTFGGTTSLYINMPYIFSQLSTTPQYNVTNLQLNTWYHIFATYDGTDGKLYVNGQQVDARSGSGPVTLGNTKTYLSKEPTNNFFFLNGLLDDQRVYPRALTAAEVLALHAGGSPVPHCP